MFAMSGCESLPEHAYDVNAGSDGEGSPSILRVEVADKGGIPAVKLKCE